VSKPKSASDKRTVGARAEQDVLNGLAHAQLKITRGAIRNVGRREARLARGLHLDKQQVRSGKLTCLHVLVRVNGVAVIDNPDCCSWQWPSRSVELRERELNRSQGAVPVQRLRA
jgi:hypothetical protein